MKDEIVDPPEEEFVVIDPPTVTENICTEPIRTVDSFLAFDATKVDPRLKSLSLWERKDFPGPLMLLCHDMCGGYKDDRFVDGTDNPNYFNFYNWAQIDIFVYFSHCFITIPPLMWIESSHKNGVPVLGTFITERKEGSLKCSRVFASAQTAVLTAELLVDIATCYGFDGWLINIENELQLVEVENVHVFLIELTRLMKFANSNSYVIWYDSVTINGELKWQDSLTDLNSAYFNCCDGMFLNYTWKDGQLVLTAELCGGRASDVFVGIDVWGRNCVGGFETHQSCEKIKHFGMSIALFAPGWVYETSDSGEEFEKKNSMYWELLRQICPPRPLKMNDLKCYFNVGAGYKQFYKGVLMGEKSWFNMKKQDLLFVCTGNVKVNSDELTEPVLVKFTKMSSYKGSSCVRIVTTLKSVEIRELIGVNIDVKYCMICLAVCLDQAEPVGAEMNPSQTSTGQTAIGQTATRQTATGQTATHQTAMCEKDIGLSLLISNDTVKPFKTCVLPSTNWIKFYYIYQTTSAIKWVGISVIKPEGYDVLVGKLRVKEVDCNSGQC